MSNEDIKVIEAMEKYGDSFVKALAECFKSADLENYKILRAAFWKGWEEYEKKVKD